MPFIAVQYRETALVGARGNAVISGHVVTIAEGNVFRNLYKVNVGDAVGVETKEGRYTYIVEEVKLVKPNAVEKLAIRLLMAMRCVAESAYWSAAAMRAPSRNEVCSAFSRV